MSPAVELGEDFVVDLDRLLAEAELFIELVGEGAGGRLRLSLASSKSDMVGTVLAMLWWLCLHRTKNTNPRDMARVCLSSESVAGKAKPRLNRDTTRIVSTRLSLLLVFRPKSRASGSKDSTNLNRSNNVSNR